MKQARSDASLAARNALVMPKRERAWPFPPRLAVPIANPGLDPAARAVLAATARAWGLPGGAPTARQAG